MTVRHIAGAYAVVGSVRNLVDGRVELQAAGEPGEIARFLGAIEESRLGPLIRHREDYDLPEESDLTGLQGFEIRP